MNQKRLNWVLQSRAYKKARQLVGDTIRSPERLRDLVAAAQAKAFANNNGKLAAIITPVSATFRLIKAYASGQYRQISFESLALIVASVIYFVMPIDAIPDFIVAMGFVDDALILSWTLRAVSGDIDKFLAWERKQK